MYAKIIIIIIINTGGGGEQREEGKEQEENQEPTKATTTTKNVCKINIMSEKVLAKRKTRNYYNIKTYAIRVKQYTDETA